MKLDISVRTAILAFGLGAMGIPQTAMAYHHGGVPQGKDQQLAFHIDSSISGGLLIEAKQLFPGRSIFGDARRAAERREARERHEAEQRESKYGAEDIGPSAPPLTSFSDTPPQNAMGISGTINTNSPETLIESIDLMLQNVSQREQLAFLEALFRVSYFDRCDKTGQFQDKGWDNSDTRRTLENRKLAQCIGAARLQDFIGEYADIYVAERRMDTDVEYVASNAFGSRRGGRTQRESIVRFINLYGDTFNNRSADYILQRNKDIMNNSARSFFGRRP
ncbi:MAG: hypothetical protein ABJG15_03185 [Hyphomonadaceae bacterium]